jgi:hypothetical protein
MAKRSGAGARRATTKTQVPAAPGNGTTEQRIVAFAEQIGRIAGTLSKKAEGLVDRKALNDQIASVRDGAAALLGHLATGYEKAAKPRAPKRGAKPAAPPKPSRGPVDAPGKKHRKPPPADPDAAAVRSQAAKLRSATPMIKTSRRRGRG